ncbi:hypothetical protein AALP_AAs52495U000100 [Arabis alpina]|uniref:Uncharacterized protein n=1 Tax=Arabis alpina TaxID=50452 RepID=A0A087G117_ARAAL|nr:hypothetical protein AALP_AAs52495U000100 [Arabis alpina]
MRPRFGIEENAGFGLRKILVGMGKFSLSASTSHGRLLPEDFGSNQIYYRDHKAEIEISSSQIEICPDAMGIFSFNPGFDRI